MTFGGLPLMACAVQRRRFPVGASPTRQPLQPEAIGAVMEVTKWLKPSISVSRIGDSASVQAVTRVNAEQSSKRTMRGCGNGAMVEPLRHRQTKGAATDMFYLTPPRHISTLPGMRIRADAALTSLNLWVRAPSS